MELFKGELTFKLSTVVERNGDAREMKNNAHEGLSSQLFDDLASMIASKGYEVTGIYSDLNHCGEAKDYQIKFVNESQQAGISKVSILKGETKVTVIEI